jgi:hypothetical protein
MSAFPEDYIHGIAIKLSRYPQALFKALMVKGPEFNHPK